MKKTNFGISFFFILSIPAAVLGIILIYASHIKREAALSACSQADFLKTFPAIMKAGETKDAPAFHHDNSFKNNNFGGFIKCSYFRNDETLREYKVTVTYYKIPVFTLDIIAEAKELK